MVSRARLVVLSLLVIAGRAEADKLQDARQAIDAVRYDEAHPLLVEAIAEGGHSPAETAELHRLLGNTLVVLGKPAEAEAAYRRWLALDPKGELPTSAAEKLRAPFRAAQAFIAQRGALAVTATRTSASIDVEVTADPMAMAAFATLDAASPSARVAIGAAQKVALPVANRAVVRLAILDEHGNRLLDVPVPVATGAVGGVDVRTGESIDGTPLYRRWPLWAVGAVAFGGGGWYFASRAQDAQERLRAIAGTHGEFFDSDVEAATADRDRARWVAGTLLAVGAGCAITSVVMLVTKPKTRAIVAPSIGPGAAAVTLHGRF